MLIGKDGKLNLPEEQRRRWSLVPGEEFFIRETPEGLLVQPADPPLSKVYVEPTTDCNLNCRICMRNSWEEPAGRMKMATYRHLVEGLSEIPSLKTVAFWGFGEPLLHPNLVEMIQSAKALGVKTELITNGLLLNRKIAEELVMADLDTLVVSIDGVSPESYGNIRSGADIRMVQDNIKALKAVRWANSRRIPEIGLEFVLMRSNLSELPKLPGLAFQMGASFIIVTNMLPYTEELKEEILYWLSATGWQPHVRSKWFPEILIPRMDARNEYLDPLVRLMRGV
ncbi:MAG: radical SAM protein [Deltaproteobacteria bacterium]|nr:MAG: radical SAM protein [Deltaproteobacteria bacterium]